MRYSKAEVSEMERRVIASAAESNGVCDTASRAGCTYRFTKAVLDRNSIHVSVKRAWDKDRCAGIVDRMNEEQLSVSEIAKELGVTRQWISVLLKKHGFVSRIIWVPEEQGAKKKATRK